ATSCVLLFPYTTLFRSFLSNRPLPNQLLAVNREGLFSIDQCNDQSEQCNQEGTSIRQHHQRFKQAHRHHPLVFRVSRPIPKRTLSPSTITQFHEKGTYIPILL